MYLCLRRSFRSPLVYKQVHCAFWGVTADWMGRRTVELHSRDTSQVILSQIGLVP